MTANPPETDQTMSLRIWGARGSLPAPGQDTVRYGGNTLCVELRCGPHLLMLDGGSGAKAFGATLMAAGGGTDCDILMSHTHLDHVCGLPFFAPMYDPKARLRFWGGHLAPPNGIARALRKSWRAPLMPDLHKTFRAAISFQDFIPGTEMEPRPGLRVATIMLRHPGNAIGYRIFWAGKSVCYVTDTEHPAWGLDEPLVHFVSGTNILIYDASYTADEYASRIGWGHSTWHVAADLGDAAGVGTLMLFHHDPGHDDATMDRIAAEAMARRPGTLVAMEGMRLDVG